MGKTGRNPVKAKVIVASAVLASVSFIGIFAVRQLIYSGKKDSTTYKVKAEIYENVIEIAGTISAAEKQTLQAKSDGTVLGVYVQKGDKVKKGDLILQLDAQEQEYNLAKLDYDMASTRISGAAKELELQKKQRLSLLQKIDDRKVVATFDGIIAALDVSVGDSMEAKDSVGTLVNVDYLTAEVEIPETDVSSLKAGQKVIFTFPAYDGEVEGYVVSWPAIGEVTTRGTTIVKAKIRIDNYPPSILPNYSFTGKIQITEPEQYLIVEDYAVGREKRQTFVETADGQKKNVEAVPYGSGYMRIIRGDISEGDVLKAQSLPKISGTKRKDNGREGQGMIFDPAGGHAGGHPGGPPGM